MGTIAPLPFVTDEILKEAENKIVAPTLKGMQEENNNFLGLLYPGLMLTKDGLEIIEFNSRFGDPETETYMRLLDSDLLQIFNACIDGTLNEIEIKWKKMFACTIVLASGGYPEKYEKGKIISGIDSSLEEYPKGEVDDLNLSTPSRKRDTPQEGNKDIVIFHAGTKYDENHNLVTNGGRVLGVSATGDNLKEALEKAYKAIEKISFEGMYYRKDIGQKTLAMKV
jgi:phosphoribosylamine--glycine ligase